MTMAVFFGIYGVIGGRLVYLGLQDPEASGPPGDAGDRLAPRHRRPQRRSAGDRHQDVVAVRRAAPHRRCRRGDRETGDGAARSRLRADLPQAEERHRLRLAEAPIVAEAAERHHEARHSRHRLSHREAPLLSRRVDGVAHCRPHQYRQPGHCRHGKIHRRAGPRPICRPRAWRWPPTCSRCGCRSTCACSTSCATRSPRRWSATTRSPPARWSSTSRPARSWRWRRCRTTIPTIRSMRTTRTG